jgi:hypothetical protein
MSSMIGLLSLQVALPPLEGQAVNLQLNFKSEYYLEKRSFSG